MKTRSSGGRYHPLQLASLLCLLLLWGPSVLAQDADNGGASSSSSGLRYGVKVGLSSSGFYEFPTKDRDHTGHVTGVAAGGFVTYPLTDIFTASAELLYLQQGGTRVELKESILGGNTVLTGNVTLHNIEIPLLIRAGLPGLLPGFKPEIVVGPSFGFNMAARQQQDLTFFIEEFPVTTDGTENVRSEFQSIQWGLHLGLGTEVVVGSHLLYFDARYRMGLSPVNNGFDAFNLLRDATDIVSNSFIFSLGFAL
ncbi:MAG: porin family protein [Cyclobacteriaceae bacterium]